jgi:MOSC domain-containing protein YiiM
MKIETICVGKPVTVEFNGREVTTAIFKYPVRGPVKLNALNLDGDGQADLNVHGGIDKALYGYAKDAYKSWQKTRPQDDFPDGAMGENLTFSSLPEENLFIGDTFALGEAIVQVVQPRFPCMKLAVKFEDLEILKEFMALKRPGVYFKVLKPGMLKEGDELKLLSQENSRLSVLELFEIQAGKALDKERKKEILTISALPESWKARLQK